ncbi:MAG: TetR/AcrR family transcriptional regulator [Myxococcota bacterium]
MATAKSTTRRRGKRTYSSPLRQQQSEETQARILEAVAAQVAEQGFQDFSVERVAARAGVSAPTVYKYFPTRDAMLDAVILWMRSRVGALPTPSGPDDLPAIVEKTCVTLDQHATAAEALILTQLGRQVRGRGASGRQQQMLEVLREELTGLPDEEARAIAGVFKHLCSLEAWFLMRTAFDVGGEQAGRTIAWAVKTLLDDLRRRKGRHA